MNFKNLLGLFLGLAMLHSAAIATAQQRTDPLSEGDFARAAQNYQRYCALCHGVNREGYANDHAPSLRSPELIAPGHYMFLFRTTAYGRPGTPMGAYREESGGPMSNREISQLVRWLYEEAEQDPRYDENGDVVRFSRARVPGDIDNGQRIYARECAQCHGANGEGGTGTALGNPVTLLFTSDQFLRDVVINGRSGTPMVSFRDRLGEQEIDDVTAYLRSRATGWDVSDPDLKRPPALDEYILNPDAAPPSFDLSEGRYVSAVDLKAALDEQRRMILLDTRVASWWQAGHIEGSVPIPYYSEFDTVADNLPKDGTWIVAYCECPRAAADTVVDELRDRGFENTAVLYEGIQGWTALNYPVVLGDVSAGEGSADP